MTQLEKKLLTINEIVTDERAKKIICDLFVEKYENCKRPYKLEELKTGMWIWDNKLKNCFLIHNIINKEKWQIVVYRNYLDDIYDILNFEENRFFPVEIFDKGDCKNEN